MPTPISRRHLWAAAAGLALLCAVASCGSGSPSPESSSSPSVAGPSASTPSSPTPSAGSSAGCAEVDALKSSLATLKDVDVVHDGIDALNSAIADVESDLSAAAAAASSDLKPELDQVRTALDAVKTAAGGLSKGNLREQAPAVAGALRQLGTATSSLSTAVAQGCSAP